ncbi:MAG: putative molybdenum-pterin-binding protein [Marmoricola sp.]|jgi:molybdopterin-binding protein|nr:putative molybdenum-pterin-binding protein [Marmoricola sp.]
MKLSTRNQLAGTVTSITRGEAMAVVKVELAGGQLITSSVTSEAVTDLDLAVGSTVTC